MSQGFLPKRVLWLIVAVVALGGLAWGALALAFPPSRVREIIQSQISSTLNREVRFEDASVGIFPPVRLTVKKPALAEAGGFAEGTAFEAHAMYLDLDVLALFARRVVVRKLVLVQPRVHLVLGEDGSHNFESLIREDAAGVPAGGTPGGSSLDLAINQISLQKGGVLIDDLKADRRMVFNVDSKLSLSTESEGKRIATRGETRITDLSFGPVAARRKEDLSTGLAGIEWQVKHNGKYDRETKRLALDPLTLGFGKAEMSLRGLIQDPGPNARVHLKTSGREVDLGEILSFLAVADAAALQGVRGAGQLDFDLEIRGAMGADKLPDLVGLARVSQGALEYPHAEARVTALEFTSRFAPDTLHISNLKAEIAPIGSQETSPVHAKLLVTQFENPLVHFGMQGEFDLAAIAPMLAPKDTRVSGRARVDVTGSGRIQQPQAVRVSGNVALKGVRVESPKFAKPIENIEGEIAFSRTKARVQRLRATSGKSSFELEAAIERPLALLHDPATSGGEVVPPADISFELRSNYMDLNELLPPAAGPGTGLPNATGRGRVAIGRLKRDRLDVENVDAQVTFDPSVVSVQTFSCDGYQGKINGTAAIELTNPQKPGFSVDARATDIEADDFLSAWTPAKGLLKGTISSDIELSGTGLTAKELIPTLTAVGLASITSGTFGPGPALDAIAQFTQSPALGKLSIRDGSIPFAVKNGRMTMREVQFDGPTGKWQLAGSVGFDGSLDYAVSITLPPAVVQNLGNMGAVAAGAMKDERGNVLLDLRVTGPAKSPKVSWDTQAMTARLQGRVSRALEELGDKFQGQALGELQGGKNGGADTTQTEIERRGQALLDSLKKVDAGGLLKDFFGVSGDK